MNKRIREQSLLQTTLQSLRESVGIIARPVSTRPMHKLAHEQFAAINLGIRGYEQTFAAVIKPCLTNEGLGHVVAEFKRPATLPLPLISALEMEVFTLPLQYLTIAL